MDNLARDISQAAEAAFIDSSIEHSLHLSPSIIDNSKKKQNDILSHIKKELKTAKEFMFSVSFIRMSGLEMLIQTFKDIENTGTVGKIITTDYLNYTEPKALHKLLTYKGYVLIFCTQTRGRTGMDVTPLVFETSASTDSAIWAYCLLFSVGMRRLERPTPTSRT